MNNQQAEQWQEEEEEEWIRTKQMKMSMTPPKSRMTAVGVKKRPSAMIFKVSSMLMKMTNTYSAICGKQRDVKRFQLYFLNEHLAGGFESRTEWSRHSSKSS